MHWIYNVSIYIASTRLESDRRRKNNHNNKLHRKLNKWILIRNEWIGMEVNQVFTARNSYQPNFIHAAKRSNLIGNVEYKIRIHETLANWNLTQIFSSSCSTASFEKMLQQTCCITYDASFFRSSLSPFRVLLTHRWNCENHKIKYLWRSSQFAFNLVKAIVGWVTSILLCRHCKFMTA